MCKLDKDELLKLLCDKYSYIIRLMKIMGVDENDVEDLTADVFVDAFKALDRLRDPDKMIPWLKTIASNRARKYFSKRAKYREIHHMAVIEAGEIDILDTIPSEMDVEKILQEAERRELVEKLINSLSDINRRIIRMRFWGDYKHAEIAEILNININTEKSIYRRSLKQLKDNYFEIFGQEELDDKAQRQ